MSKTAPDNQDSGWFFKQVSAATRRVLFINCDGAAAPFASGRARGIPYPKIPESLRRIMISCRTRVIAVSGRAAHEVPPLLGLHPTPEIWGAHGLERIYTDGHYEEVRVNEDALQILAEAEAGLEREHLGQHIEVKLAGVALHWRGLPSTEASAIRRKGCQLLEPLAAGPNLVLTESDEGLELRLASANKGDALREFLLELDHDVPVAYLGGDATDEDAFCVLNGRGLSVLVGLKPTVTAAQLRLEPPDELMQFLSAWIQACGEVQ